MDIGLAKTPVYTHQHIQRILPGIQKAINDVKITSEHIHSVSILSWLALMSGDLCTAHRHQKGLFLMFLETRQISFDGTPTNNPDPMLMFLYRMALKVDNTLAYRNFPQAFPPITDHDCFHRQWLPHFITKQEDLESCLAAFKLDDFTNQICHLHRKARQLGYQSQIDLDPTLEPIATKLLTELEAWHSLPMIQPHVPLIIPQNPFVPSSKTENQFLQYPPYSVKDPLFAQMMLIHASLLIHLSIVITGTLGPYPQLRHDFAVQICRIYAALVAEQGALKKTGQSRLINALWLAGLVFGSSDHSEGNASAILKLILAFDWLEKALLGIDKGKGYRAASKLADSLNEIWADNGDVDPWEVVGRIFDSAAVDPAGEEMVVDDTE